MRCACVGRGGKRAWALHALLAQLSLGIAGSAYAQGESAAYFKGRTIQAVVGYQGGSTYDLYLRSFGRHVQKHLPGNPTVVVQNMPGAGALTATIYLANLAAKDGTVIGILNPANMIEPLINPETTKFDPRAFEWIGNLAQEHTSCGFWAKDITTLDDLKKREIAIGSTGPTAGSSVEAKLVSGMLGLKFRIVEGYRGLAEVRLAAARGEVDGHCALFMSVLRSEQREAWAAGRIKVPLQIGLTGHPEFGNTPNLFDLVSEGDKQLLRLLIGQWAYARPITLPPGTPAERVAAWRAAFEATLKDPEFRAEMEKARLDVVPMSADKIAPLIAQTMATPLPVVERARALLKGK